MTEKTNSQKKQAHWDNLLKKIKHLEGHCTIGQRGVEDETPYYHPILTLKEGATITAQCDLGNDYMYAIQFNMDNAEDRFSIGVDDSLLEALVIGWYSNKDVVLMALTTLKRINNHISTLKDYCSEYITNILIGSSVKDITKNFIHELNAVDGVIDIMRNSNKKDRL